MARNESDRCPVQCVRWQDNFSSQLPNNELIYAHTIIFPPSPPNGRTTNTANEKQHFRNDNNVDWAMVEYYQGQGCVRNGQNGKQIIYEQKIQYKFRVSSQQWHSPQTVKIISFTVWVLCWQTVILDEKQRPTKNRRKCGIPVSYAGNFSP